MKNILKRVERVRVALVGREMEKSTLVYTDGSKRSMNILEAVNEISRRDDVVDVLAQDETTRSLLLAMLDPWDFSDLEELAGQ